MVGFIVFFVLLGYIYESGDSLFVSNDSLTICGTHQYNIKVHITDNSRLIIRQWNGNDSTGWLLLRAQFIYLHDSSSIIGSAKGYLGGDNLHPNGYGLGYGSAGTSGGGGGGGYGGNGGDGGDLNPGSGGSVYGNLSDTVIAMGSGGGAGRLSQVDGRGGNGGARIYLRARTIINDSSYITAYGQQGYDGNLEAGGGGSGGGIMFMADSVRLHRMSLSVNGGNGGNGEYGGGGGGGGGRIKIFYSSLLDTLGLIRAVQGGGGGVGNQGSNGENGMPGTVYVSPIINVEEGINKFSMGPSVSATVTKGIITVKTDELPAQLRVYDISGCIIKSFYLKNKTETIELNKLSCGIYFLEFTCQNQSLIKIILLK